MKSSVLLSALAVATALAAPASAALLVDGVGSTSALASGNSFAAQLNSNYGYTQQTTDYSGISLTAPARITFYALASESGYANTFSFEGLSNTENAYSFDSSRVIGSLKVAAGSLAGMSFTSNLGLPALPGQPNFAVFLPTGFNGGSFSSNWLVFGFDDGYGKSNKADYDDFIVGAQISAIPEPHTWAMVIAGFGLVGLQLRRSRNKSLPSVAC